jgi:hypothetical protein
MRVWKFRQANETTKFLSVHRNPRRNREKVRNNFRDVIIVRPSDCHFGFDRDVPNDVDGADVRVASGLRRTDHRPHRHRNPGTMENVCFPNMILNYWFRFVIVEQKRIITMFCTTYENFCSVDVKYCMTY